MRPCHPRPVLAPAVVAASLLLATPALAATIRVPGDFSTIQAAVNAAAPVGDTIEVSPGVYDDDVDIFGKTVTIVGLGSLPGDVVIGGSITGPVVQIENGSAVTLRNVRITGGDNVLDGGGLDVRGSALVLEDAVVDGNAAERGGGLHTFDSGITIRRTLIAGNTAESGGGAASFASSTVLLEDSLVRDNEGSIYALAGTVTIRRTRLWDNVNELGSVLYQADRAVMKVSNSVIDRNTARYAVYSTNGPAVELVNVTIADNDFGDAHLSGGPGAVSLVNSIVAGDPDLPVSIGGDLDVSSSLLPAAGDVSGPGLVFGEPIWKPLSFYQLDAGSPGIDAADSSVIFPDPDFLGQPRLVDDENIADSGAGPLGYLDMGAIERRPAIRYVDDSATGTGSGLSWADAMPDLQDALDDAATGDVEEIWIATGTYRPDRGTGDRGLSFALQDGLLILGGFAGSEPERADRDPSVFNTILSGAIGDPDSILDNSFHVVRADGVGPTGVLSGVIIQRGVANEDVADGDGGGMLILGGAPIIDDVVIRQCQAARFGSAIFMQDASPRMNRVRINRNGWASDASGTLVVDGGAPVMINLQVNGNRNADFPAVQMRQLDGAVLSNVTIWGNETDGATAGMDVRPGSVAEIANAIVWGNVPANPAPGQTLDKDNAVGIDGLARYTTVEGWPAFGPGNDGREPGFVDAAGPDGIAGTADDDLRLAAGSCLIDAGDNTGVPAFIGRDLAGVTRRLDDPGTADTGNGTGPIVDRGAHEFDGVSCGGDVDGNGDVGFDDLLAVLASWGPCPGCPADLNCDDVVDFDDLLTVLAAWGPCP
jgi:hypothetical protein